MRNKLMSTTSVAAVAMAAGLLTSAFSSTAIADGYEPAGKGFVPAPVVNRWGGFYLGAHVGAGQANMDASFRSSAGATPTVFDNLNTDGVLAGIHGGFHWQSGRGVFGIEADWSFMDWDDTVSRAWDDSGSIEVASARAEIDSLASVRAKIGVTVGHDQSVLLFVNGGAAWADVDALVCLEATCSPSERANFSFDDVGAVVGGGFEYAMTDRFRLRVDGSYYWFDDTKFDAFGGDPVSSTSTRFEFDDIYTFRVGGTFYFTRTPRPVAALK